MQTVSVRFFSFIAINKRLKEEAVKRSSRCEEVAICGYLPRRRQIAPEIFGNIL